MHGSLPALPQHDTASYCAYVYGIGIHPICIRDVQYMYGTSRTRMGQYMHTGQTISTNQFIMNTWSFGVGAFWNNSLIVKACM